MRIWASGFFFKYRARDFRAAPVRKPGVYDRQIHGRAVNQGHRTTFAGGRCRQMKRRVLHELKHVVPHPDFVRFDNENPPCRRCHRPVSLMQQAFEFFGVRGKAADPLGKFAVSQGRSV